ncbi:LysR family transcriptional regulator [Streptomyces sp. NPDC001634]|uniref:LysR family transcriptional regulator n=1 Tax=Streptomyces sp. NPDC001634 TaxID=3154390 RepID=UPI0033258960
MTAQIRTLEQQTGRELFTRLPRGVEPSPHAHELAGRIAAPLDAPARLEDTGDVTAPVHLAGPSELMSVEECLLVASPAWAERVAGQPSTEDLCAALRDVPMVTYAEDLPIVRRYWRNVFGKQLTARAAVTVPNPYAVLSAVNAGAGYSVLPRSLCQEHLDSGRLALLHNPEEPPLNTLFLVQRPGADTNPDVIRVRDRLRQAARTW